jgi:hypothetical protein
MKCQNGNLTETKALGKHRAYVTQNRIAVLKVSLH